MQGRPIPSLSGPIPESRHRSVWSGYYGAVRQTANQFFLYAGFCVFSESGAVINCEFLWKKKHAAKAAAGKFSELPSPKKTLHFGFQLCFSGAGEILRNIAFTSFPKARRHKKTSALPADDAAAVKPVSFGFFNKCKKPSFFRKEKPNEI